MLDVLTAEQLPGRICEAIKGGATRLMCPKCGGGQSKEISLSVRPLPGMDGSVPLVQLKCFRSSCDWHANVMFGEGAYFKLVRQQVHEAKIYDKPTKPAKLGIQGLLRRYELEPENYDGRWHVYTEGDGVGTYHLVAEVRGPSGELRGHQTRTFYKPKRCQAYKQSAQPWLDWWLQHELCTGRLFIVEDQISACKIHATGIASAVSLMGTNMPVDKAREIADECKHRDMRPMLALDPDASGKAFAFQKKYAHIMPDMGVFVFKRDPKDTPMDELRRLINV